MEQATLRLGILGFGEAGFRFAKDFAQAGVADIVVYSHTAAKAAAGDAVYERAKEIGVQLAKSPREVAKRADLIIALTPGRSVIPVLRSIRKHLRPEQIYVDASSAAVTTMERAAEMMNGSARFVDAAIMSPVPLNGIKAATVASGEYAEQFRTLMTPYGMNIKVVGDKPGMASAMKLIRSVCIKGLSAVLLESLEAAQRYGVLEAAAADIAQSIDERPFTQNMNRYVCGTAMHAARRVHEMADALALLRSLGSSTRMTQATRSKLDDVAQMGLREKFSAREPDSIAAVMEAIVAVTGSSDPGKGAGAPG